MRNDEPRTWKKGTRKGRESMQKRRPEGGTKQPDGEREGQKENVLLAANGKT
jgi:hypothetical protein